MIGEGRGSSPENPHTPQARRGDRSDTDASAMPQPAGPAIEPGALLAEAWGIFSAVWPTCLVVYWGACAAGWLIINLLVIVLASLNVAAGDPAITPFLEFLRFLGTLLIPIWLWLGQCIAFLKIARRQPVEQADLFRGGPYLLTAVLAIAAFLAIAAVPCLIVYGSIEGLLALGGGDSLVTTVENLLPAGMHAEVARVESVVLVSMALMIVLLGLWYTAFFAVRVRLRPFCFLIVDRRAGVFESLRTSMTLTRGRASTLLLVHLAQFTINVAGLLTCCLGLVVALPLTSLVSAITYHALARDLPPVEIADDDEESTDSSTASR
jgi:hypothetical protein